MVVFSLSPRCRTPLRLSSVLLEHYSASHVRVTLLSLSRTVPDLRTPRSTSDLCSLRSPSSKRVDFLELVSTSRKRHTRQTLVLTAHWRRGNLRQRRLRYLAPVLSSRLTARDRYRFVLERCMGGSRFYREVRCPKTFGSRARYPHSFPPSFYKVV